MASLISGVEAGFEPIPGYVLRERIGSGGYGEVWLADAPGGLQKAVKFVFGSVDERAGGELRALQRIRSVHHPFILSLERIEVLEGQLVVVTELADGTLLDRFREFQQRGLGGIPRDRLLEYLRDTADALDFLCQKHELQHLDIKPANLLLVADRVKVADFGLIKDIQNKSMSLMSGMTPTYASPEMFDGRPGRFSDQYSLAIVYQEMLTGSLPFHGRTTAQLATEHLQKAPDLGVLPIADRAVVAKAMSKKPSQRFASCREFIDALLSASLAVPTSPEKNTERPTHAPPQQSTRRTPRFSGTKSHSNSAPRTTSWEIRAAADTARDIALLPPLEIPKHVAGPMADCYVIGLGGTGAEVLKATRVQLENLGLDLSQLNEVGWALLDIDEQSIQAAALPDKKGALSVDDVLHLPLQPASEYRSREQQLYSPLSRRWLYNVPRTGRTEGVRPMAMLAILDNADSIYQFLHNRLEQFARSRVDGAKPIRIYLVGSSHGGTGSVFAVEIGFLVQQILIELGIEAYVQAVICVAERTDGPSTELATACGIACMREIAHYYRTDGLHPGIPGLPYHHLSIPPWNNVYLVYGGRLGRPSGWNSAVQQISDFLCVDACTALGSAFDQAREESFEVAASDPECEWQPWLRTFATRRLDLTAELNPELVVKRILLHQLQECLVSLRFAAKAITSNSGENSPQNQRLIQQQIDLLVSDLFREKQWSAQSWVRQCMDFLVPTSAATQKEKNSLTSATGHSKALPPGELVDEFSALGLDRVSAALGISLEHSQSSARAMLDRSIASLVKWTDQHGLNLLLKHARLSEVFAAIDRRFVSQSDSLNTVATKLSNQRDELLEILHGKNASSSPSQSELAKQELSQQIRSLNFQSALHHTAGAMLSRLRENFRRTAELWKVQAQNAQTRFSQAVEILAHGLNIPLDAEGQARENWLSLPPSWSKVRESVLKVTSDAIQRSIRPSSVDAILQSDKVGVEDSLSDGNSVEERNDLGPACSPQEWLQTIIEKASRIAKETATADNLIQGVEEYHESSPGDPADDQSAMDRQAVFAQLENFDASLLGDGGAMRKILMLPQDKIDDESMEKLRASMNGAGTVVEMDGIGAALLFTDGERLDVAELIDRLWKPTTERNQLAERLHSRSDVDWLSIDQ